MIESTQATPPESTNRDNAPRLIAYLTEGRLALDRRGVATLRDRILALQRQPPGAAPEPRLWGPALGQVMDEVIARRGPDVGACLYLAAAAAGVPLALSLIGRFLPSLDFPELLPVLVGRAAGTPRERAQELLDLLATDRLDNMEHAIGLWLVVELCGAAEPPPALRALLRTAARQEQGAICASFIGNAASRVNDPQVRRLAGRWITASQQPLALARITRYRQALHSTTLGMLPEEAVRTRGVTVRRPVERVGRNDVCPCGSGKKYKRCCAPRDAALQADPSPVPGVTMADFRRNVHQYLSQDKFDQLSAQELDPLDLTTLPVSYLNSAMITYLAWKRFEVAERIMDLLDGRPLEERDREVTRAHLISKALEHRQLDLAKRQYEKLGQKHLLGLPDWVAMALVWPHGRSTFVLERAFQIVLADPREGELQRLARSLLRHAPALGILVARASLGQDQGKKTYELLEAVEQARDHLGLPARDRSLEIHDRLTRLQLQERIAARARSSEEERLQSQAFELQARAQESAARVAELERRLQAQEAALRQARGAPAADAGGAADEERRRLQGKIGYLKGLIAEGNKERTELRAQLADMSDALSEATLGADEEGEEEGEADPAAPYEVDGADPDAGDGFEAGEGAEVGRRTIRCPQFSRAAREGLLSLPARVAREALQSVAALAAGDDATWRAVKRLRSVTPPLWSVRVGIHHRLLFRIEQEGALELLELFHRKDLEGVLKQRRYL